jgi:transposase-like protein
MKFDTLFRHWGSIAAICTNFGVTHQTVYNWRKAKTVPKGVACEAHIRSGYKIPINLKAYE